MMIAEERKDGPRAWSPLDSSDSYRSPSLSLFSPYPYQSRSLMGGCVSSVSKDINIEDKVCHYPHKRDGNIIFSFEKKSRHAFRFINLRGCPDLLISARSL